MTLITTAHPRARFTSLLALLTEVHADVARNLLETAHERACRRAVHRRVEALALPEGTPPHAALLEEADAAESEAYSLARALDMLTH